ncbi:sugar kinase [Microbacterium sp. P5_E9]
MTRLIAIGECMAELTRRGGTAMTLGFAGDTFNTAVYFKRLAGDDAAVGFVTAVGDDALTADQLAFMDAEGIDVHAQRVGGGSPALYIVSTDDVGERTFTYYRDASPVRRLLDPEHDEGARMRDRIGEVLRAADIIYLSAITLQQLVPAARSILLDLVARARDGGALVAFDSNYRPRGWPSVDHASFAVLAAAAVTDIALPSLADERQLFGGGDAAAVIARYREAGVQEVVVKDGGGDIVVGVGDTLHRFAGAPIRRPIDTTGAGDSFNAGYLHARANGASVADAVAQASAVSRTVIGHPGAIVDRAVSLGVDA